MSQQQSFFIGFTTLESFLSAVNDQLDLNLAPIEYISHGEYFDTITACVIASQVKDGHLVYWKMDAAKWTRNRSGENWGPTSIDRAQRAPKLQQQIVDIATDMIYRHLGQSLCIQAGLPSFPANLILIDGQIDSATYDRDTGAIVLKQYSVTEEHVNA